MNALAPSISEHFAGKSPGVQATYDALLKAVAKFGQVTEDPKKTSIHLNRRTAFAGVATRRESLVLTIKAAKDIEHRRVRRHEQASANRWHLEVGLASPDEVDAELVAWLKAAYELSA